MLDFKKELEKLFDGDNDLLGIDEFGMLADEGTRLLAAIDKRQADISLQVEEIYDIAQRVGTDHDALRLERERSDQLLRTVIGLTDIIEDFVHFASDSGDQELSRQSMMMWDNSGILLEKCSLTRLNGEGRTMDPDFHTVYETEPSACPREQITRVLQSGYTYKGAVVRRASVVVSDGSGEYQLTEGEENADE